MRQEPLENSARNSQSANPTPLDCVESTFDGQFQPLGKSLQASAYFRDRFLDFAVILPPWLAGRILDTKHRNDPHARLTCARVAPKIRIACQQFRVRPCVTRQTRCPRHVRFGKRLRWPDTPSQAFSIGSWIGLCARKNRGHCATVAVATLASAPGFGLSNKRTRPEFCENRRAG